MNLIFKHVRGEGGCSSFIIADAKSRKATIIDPRADEIDTYEEFLGERKLTVAIVVDTHTHADHYSGTHLIARKFEAPIAMGDKTKSARARLRLQDGQGVGIGGALGFEVLETPGHTPDSVSLLVKGDWGQAVFTGDTLFIGGSGRTDFPGADAGSQYDSIHKKLGALGEGTWVFPAHDYSDLLFSTIGYERKTNPHWLVKNRDEFVRTKDAEALASGGIIRTIVEFNMNANPSTQPKSGAHTQCATACDLGDAPVRRESVAEYREILESGAGGRELFVDVREPSEFAQGYMPGVRNIPMSELFLHWDELKRADRVHFSCARGGRSQIAAQSIARLGLTNVVSVDGGFAAWVAAAFPVTK